MRAIALSLALAFVLAGEVKDEITDLLGTIAADLSAENAPGVLSAFDKKIALYGRLQNDVPALVQRYDVASEIEILSITGEGAARDVKVDWVLAVRDKNPDQPARQVDRRRAVVEMRVEKQGRRWRITALRPESFFAP
jgi:hypothetical protein